MHFKNKTKREIKMIKIIKKRLAAFMSSVENLEVLREVLSHSSFFGSVVAAVFGVPNDSASREIIVVLWFIVMLGVALQLNSTIEELQERAATEEAARLKELVAAAVSDGVARGTAAAKVPIPTACWASTGGPGATEAPASG